MTTNEIGELLALVPEQHQELVKKGGLSQQRALLEKLKDDYKVEHIEPSGSILVNRRSVNLWIFTDGEVAQAS